MVTLLTIHGRQTFGALSTIKVAEKKNGLSVEVCSCWLKRLSEHITVATLQPLSGKLIKWHKLSVDSTDTKGIAM